MIGKWDGFVGTTLASSANVMLCALLICIAPLPTAAQDTSSGYFVEVEIDKAAPYVGEAVQYTLSLYAAAALPSNPRYLPPTFAGFWQDEPVEAPPRAETINGRRFDVYTIHTRLFPLQGGALTIEPGELRVRTGGVAPLVLQGQPITLDVQPLPPSMPANFSGAVGQYTIEARLDRTTAIVGEPLTLTLTARGVGNLAQTTPPPLALPPGWRAYERPAEYRPWTGSTPDEKIFTWLIVPAQPGSITLTPPEWVYFDPAAGTYQTASAAAFTVDVQPGAAAPADLPPQPARRSALAIKPVPDTFEPPLFRLDANFWLLWLLPPGAILLIGGAVSAWRLWAARSEARPVYTQQLRRAGKGDSTAVERILLNYFAERLKLPPEEVQIDTLPALMQANGVSAELGGQVMACLQAVQAKRFAPAADISGERLLSHARSLLRTLNKEWEGE